MPRFLLAFLSLFLFASAAAACPFSGHEMSTPDETVEESTPLIVS